MSKKLKQNVLLIGVLTVLNFTFSSSTSLFDLFFSDPGFTVEGKFDISITDKKTVTSTRVHDQGKTGLCWDYAAASSVRKSLRIKLGRILSMLKLNFNFNQAALLTNGYEKDNALKFIDQGDHHQVLRKEILFALRPTTLTG